jgi:hypothetical protein
MFPSTNPSLTGSEADFRSAKSSQSSGSWASCKELASPWNKSRDVLWVGDLPTTCTIRPVWLTPCPCKDRHSSFSHFCRAIIDPSLRKGEPVPQIEVCWNTINLWESRLPRELTGCDKNIHFSDLPSMWHVHKVLYQGTHWFRRLMRKDGSHSDLNGKAVLRLIAGLPFCGREEVWQLLRLKPTPSGLMKLRNILSTVDGLLMQLILSFPMWEVFLDWKRIDQVINCLVCQLLPDYFRNEIPEKPSAYQKIKRLRNAIKELGFNPIGDIKSIDIPREMSFFKVITDFMSDRKTPIDMYRVMVMSQTRAAGVPPRSVYLESLKKIKATLTERPDPARYERVKYYVADAIDEIHQEMVESLGSESQAEHFWTRVINRAKISLSDSGEFFTNSQSGGKLEAARKVLSKEPNIREINLETGAFTGNVLTSNDPVGIRLFHWALSHFLDRKKVYDTNVMSVRISLVAELGKWRAITVSHLAHAITLHVLSHVLLEYIKEVPSSRSGVGAANHAWNFFKRLSHKNPAGNFIFGDKDVYLFSTDWEEATDFCDHLVAQAMINRLCYRVGIPTWYRQTCVFALCAPRQVEEMDEDKVLSRYFTTRGELMGDPVVKVILHCYHLVARYAAVKQMRSFR